MKKVVITGERQVEIVEVPTPRPKDNWALVKVRAIPMCTEYKAYLNGDRFDFLGHEAAGEVVEVAQACRVKPGDRVVVMPQYPCGTCPLCLAGDYIHCQHCPDFDAFTGSPEGKATYADCLLKHDWRLVPIPEDMSYKHAGMACCGLGPTFNACQTMRVGAFDTVLITGLGPVGLGGVINACYRGARVIGADGNPYRAALARKLGAETVVDPGDASAVQQIMALTGGVGADKAIDCSGVAAAQRLCIDTARRKGHVSFVGEAGDLTVAVSRDLIRKGLTLHGVWHYNLADTPGMMRLIRDSAAALDTLITHTFPFDRVRDALELQVTGECGKIVLEL
jgi:L-iditol 2-dehydrogenase